jgi:DNA-binding LytR/AlgR family response regulator
MTSIGILIVDDEVLIAEYLKDILVSLDMNQVRMAHERQQAMEMITLFRPDIILLDIKMDSDRTGITMAEEIGRLYQIPVIFITAYSDRETITAALNTKPAAYITKPFKKMDIYAAVSIVIKERDEKNKSYFVFRDGYTTVRLLISEIIYFEGMGNYVIVVTKDKKYSIRETLYWCLEKLPLNKFVQTHRSYIVNLDKIEKSSTRHVIANGNVIPVSRNRRKDFIGEG